MSAHNILVEGPPIIERIEDPDQLLAQIIECLQFKDERGLKTYILEHKLKNQSLFWELILKIGECVTEDNNENHQPFFDVCNRCLMYLVRVGNPKETLLAVLEQMDSCIDDVKFISFLQLIQTSLQKIPKKLFHSLDIALETVSAHLKGIQVPDNDQYDGDEIKLFHLDKTVVRLIFNLEAYLKFVEPFVKAVDITSIQNSEQQFQEAAVLKKHLVQVFDHPLCRLILSYDDTVDKYKSDGRLCAEHAMTLLSQLETNFYTLLSNNRQDSGRPGTETLRSLLDADDINEEEDNLENEEREKKQIIKTNKSECDLVENWGIKVDLSPYAEACIVYLLHCEKIGIEKFPSIFTHSHLLEFHLETLAFLLESTIFVINMKGLLLGNSLISLIEKDSIASEDLDNPGYLKVINNLIMIMTKCPVKEHRLLSTKIFPKLISKFVPGGRHKIYVNILSSCFHSGVKGFLITCIKDDIAKNLQSLKQSFANGDNGGVSLKTNFFIGKQLKKLLHHSLDLPDKETTDMLENSDQIISGLNLLRFLVVADQSKTNLTKVWDYMPEIDKDFIEPLRKGLNLSKAHYKLEHDNVTAGREGALGGPDMSVQVAGSNLPTVEKKEKIELIEKALLTHDMMIGLVARLSELIDQSSR